MQDVEQTSQIIQLIYQFGVLPILVYIIKYLYQENRELQKEIKELNSKSIEREKETNKEIREIEKENVTLLYKTLSTLKRIKNGDIKEH